MQNEVLLSRVIAPDWWSVGAVGEGERRLEPINRDNPRTASSIDRKGLGIRALGDDGIGPIIRAGERRRDGVHSD